MPNANSQQDNSINSTPQPNNTPSITTEFPSGHLLLETIQKEFEIESSRKRDIETRTGILIALLGALIGFYANALDFSIFKEASTSLEYICVVLLGLLYLSPICTFLMALKQFLNILDAKAYQRIGLGGFNIQMAAKPSAEVATRLTDSYKSVLEDNDKVNEQKAKQFKKGITYMYISLIAVITAFLIKEIISLTV